ncbi:hypothetical protein [Streptomyces sp. AC495_CC817]|uniref:hypothetical protein n=1 Tax=Streptomyces sp. AC495_CC817 TaxID=2823900 RepID=UPI001C25832C|nr:hypothetical protein [Streptomyces sp. AC495_CC817]
MTSENRILPLPDTGAHLVTGADGRLRVRLRTGRLTLVDASSAELHDALLRGQHAGGSDVIRRLTAEVCEREAADTARRWPRARRAVCLLGDGPVLDALGDALAAWGAQVTRRPLGAEPSADAELVVAVADDAHGRRDWSAHDELPQRGIAWLRVRIEGECVVIDPLSLTADDATSEQVDARRIAASSAPSAAEEWHRSAPRAGGSPDAATTVLAVARLLHTIVAWAQDDPALDRLRTTLWKLVPATGVITEHTVLPVPAAPARVVR